MHDSISIWIQQVKEGDEDAALALWTRYFADLVRLAQVRLGQTNRGMSDEEDVAISAFESFFRAAQEGRLRDLADREGLWRLLSSITHRKAVDVYRFHARQKRGQGKVLDEAGLAAGKSTSFDALAQISDKDFEPHLTSIIVEEYQNLLNLLGDADLRAIAVAKMEGYSNDEIAGRINCSLRTVERRLQLIRQTWETYRDSGDSTR